MATPLLRLSCQTLTIALGRSKCLQSVFTSKTINEIKSRRTRPPSLEDAFHFPRESYGVLGSWLLLPTSCNGGLDGPNETTFYWPLGLAEVRSIRGLRLARCRCPLLRDWGRFSYCWLREVASVPYATHSLTSACSLLASQLCSGSGLSETRLSLIRLHLLFHIVRRVS